MNSMEGNLVGVFGSNPDGKAHFLSSIAKKSETEGVIVYSRVEAGKRYSFLDDGSYPDRLQGYARIASICDFAYYLFPTTGKLSPPDGELAVLLDSLGVDGMIQLVDASSGAFSDLVKASFKTLRLSLYQLSERSSKSSVLDLSGIQPRKDLPKDKTLIYIDRAFNVKGVGLVVLGFVLSGRVSLHDKLRLIPGETGKLCEVKGIQISDEDYEQCGRGIRVGLSLKGVELKDLEKTSWLDDGSFELSSDIEFDFWQTPYYKQSTVNRDSHLETNGELLVAKIEQAKTKERRIARLAVKVPHWSGMPLCMVDLNSKPLRIAGGGKTI
jgi:selenocysteine-specific translation elongation factor